MPIRILMAAIIVFVSAPSFAQDIELSPDWPKLIEGSQGSVLVYQPQIEQLTEITVRARAAVAVSNEGQAEPIYGAIWLSGKINTDYETRMTVIEEISIEDSRFPNDESGELAQNVIRDALDGKRTLLSLDRLLTGLSVAELAERDIGDGNYNMAPPQIYVATEPTLLVLIDGEPRLQAVENSTIQKVINTPFMILSEPGSGTYYLFTGQQWFSSNDIESNWVNTQNVPQSVRTAIEEVGSAAPAQAENGAVPISYSEIIVSTVPSSLVQLDGEKAISLIPRTDLLFVGNTDSDILIQIGSQEHFILLSGRWFKTANFETLAEWEWVDPDNLPMTFSNIPENSPKANVLASVPGTVQAEEALIQARIPQTAKVDRRTASLEVTYAGEPQFEDVEGTVLGYAVNTEVPVISFQGTYYAVHDGVWFTAPNEEGPWSVATSVPDEIYEIPPTDPLHRVTYVYVYDSTPDYVYTGYWPGYYGSYYYHGTMIYGTGWHYPPYYYGPYYYGRPITYGFGFAYNGATGNWVIGVGFGAGWVGYGYGRYGYNDIDIDVGEINFNRDRNLEIGDRNIYDRWDGGAIADRVDRDQLRQQFEARNIQNASDRLGNVDRGSIAQNLGGNPQARQQLAESGVGQAIQNTGAGNRSLDEWRASPNAAQVRDQANDVVADRNGDIHRRNGDGSWQRRQPNNTWDNPRRTNQAVDRDLNRTYQSRARGTSRTNQYRSSYGARGAGMRGAGGGFGGGRGGFRRR